MLTTFERGKHTSFERFFFLSFSFTPTNTVTGHNTAMSPLNSSSKAETQTYKTTVRELPSQPEQPQSKFEADHDAEITSYTSRVTRTQLFVILSILWVSLQA